jgi:hypothetical protein
MGLVDFYLGVLNGVVLHDHLKQVINERFEQIKAVVLDITDHLLGDGFIIECLRHGIALGRRQRVVVNTDINHHILAFALFIVVKANKGAQAQIFNVNSAIAVAVAAYRSYRTAANEL